MMLRLLPVLSQLGEVMRGKLHRALRRAVCITILAGLAFIACFFAMAAGAWAVYLVLLAEMSAPAAAALMALGLFAVGGLFAVLMARVLLGSMGSVPVRTETKQPAAVPVADDVSTPGSILSALAIGVLTGFLSGRRSD